MLFMKFEKKVSYYFHQNHQILFFWTSAINSLTTKKQTTKFSPANFKKIVKSKLYHIEDSKTRGQTV